MGARRRARGRGSRRDPRGAGGRPRRGDEREGRPRALARRAGHRGDRDAHARADRRCPRSAGGTAAITDAGMTGPHDSVIGVKAHLATQRMRTGLPVRFEVADGGVRIEGVLVACDPGSGRATGDHAGSGAVAP